MSEALHQKKDMPETLHLEDGADAKKDLDSGVDAMEPLSPEEDRRILRKIDMWYVAVDSGLPVS